MRAYSMASANHEETRILLHQGRRRPADLEAAEDPRRRHHSGRPQGDRHAGHRQFVPGNRLLLLSTGTGLAPFASLIKDPDVYERFETIVLVHGCRQVSELAYGEELVAKLRDDELFGPLLSEKLLYYPTVTREPFRNRGRITDLITSDQLFNDLHQAPLNIETDRIMMCGSPAMLEELKPAVRDPRFRRRQQQQARSFRDREGVRGALSSFVVIPAMSPRAPRHRCVIAHAGYCSTIPGLWCWSHRPGMTSMLP